jgi:hypothetical protein
MEYGILNTEIKHLSPRIFYPEMLSFKIEGEIKPTIIDRN